MPPPPQMDPPMNTPMNTPMGTPMENVQAAKRVTDKENDRNQCKQIWGYIEKELQEHSIRHPCQS